MGYKNRSAIKVAVGSVIRERRQAIGLSRKQLAAACEINHTYLGNIELGYAKPSLRLFFTLCDGLGVSPGWLLQLIELRAPREFQTSRENTMVTANRRDTNCTS